MKAKRLNILINRLAKEQYVVGIQGKLSQTLDDDSILEDEFTKARGAMLFAVEQGHPIWVYAFRVYNGTGSDPLIYRVATSRRRSKEQIRCIIRLLVHASLAAGDTSC